MAENLELISTIEPTVLSAYVSILALEFVLKLTIMENTKKRKLCILINIKNLTIMEKLLNLTKKNRKKMKIGFFYKH